MYFCTKGIDLTMDYSKLNDINYYVNYAIGDTEGFNIDGGEKYGGTTIVYLPGREEIDLYGHLPCVAERKKMYGNMVTDYEKGDILNLDLRNWDGSVVAEDALNGEVVIILYDKITNGKTLNYTAEKFRKMGVGEVYVYTSRIDEDVFDKENDNFVTTLDCGIVGEIYTKDTSLYDRHKRITLIDQPFYDYFD